MELTGLMTTAVSDSLQGTNLPPATKSRLKQLLNAAAHPMSGSNLFGLNQGRFNTVEEYDSLERTLPDSLKDGWLKRTLTLKLVAAGEEYERDPQRFKEKFWENWLHSFPKILFWSLPFFALILNILYFRRKKQFYYVDHGIFTIHFYIATLPAFADLYDAIDPDGLGGRALASDRDGYPDHSCLYLRSHLPV